VVGAVQYCAIRSSMGDRHGFTSFVVVISQDLNLK
jgi:hypothetical protein